MGDEGASECREVHGSSNGSANSDLVMRPFTEARDTTVLEGSQSSQRSTWLQQLQQHKKDVVLIVLLSIMLPSWDVYSDLALTITLALEGEVYYALCLLAPQLVNIGLTAVLWHRIEPKEHRHWSWILLPLQIWPQVLSYGQSTKHSLKIESNVSRCLLDE